MKKISFIKICNDLDKQGFYKSADNLEKLIKISQGIYGAGDGPDFLPSQLRETRVPYTGNPLIDSYLDPNADTAMGIEYADGRMYDTTGAYEGPGRDSPFITGLSPTEQSQMSPQELKSYLESESQKAANYIAGIYEPFAQLSALYGIIGSAGGDQTIKDNLFEQSMPMFSANLQRQLSSRPLETWPQLINEVERTTRQAVGPDKASKVSEILSKTLRDVVRNSKLDPSFADKLKKSPQVQKLFRDYSVVT